MRRDASLAPAGVSAGYEPGPTAGTLRDPAVPFRWSGLSANDAALLERFLELMPRPPDELHTHIPVGRLPYAHEDEDDPDTAKLLRTLWPRRIDAMCRWGEDWYLIECKPDAAHFVVGQVLCYFHWLLRERPDLAVPVPLVLTDTADADVLPVLEALGITVLELDRLGGGVELGDGVA